MRYILTTLLLLLLPLATVHAEKKPAETQCTPTKNMMLGNNYIPGIAGLKINTGEELKIKGRVLSGLDCSPIEDAIIERWQAGADGEYHKDLRAYTMTLPDGTFEFQTVWPNIEPAHIHFIVTVGGYNKLTTQWIPDKKVSDATIDFVLTPSMF